MAKNQNTYEKMRREAEKKRKAEEKRQGKKSRSDSDGAVAPTYGSSRPLAARPAPLPPAVELPKVPPKPAVPARPSRPAGLPR